MTANVDGMPYWLQILLLCVATFRLTRLVSQDQITQPIRDRLDRWEAEGRVDLDKHRVPTRRARGAAWLNEMLSCGWCSSWWCGLFVAVAWWAAVGVPDPLLWVPVVALTASAFSGVVVLVVAGLETVSDD